MFAYLIANISEDVCRNEMKFCKFKKKRKLKTLQVKNESTFFHTLYNVYLDICFSSNCVM